MITLIVHRKHVPLLRLESQIQHLTETEFKGNWSWFDKPKKTRCHAHHLMTNLHKEEGAHNRIPITKWQEKILKA